MAKKSKKSLSGLVIFLIICLATAGMVYGIKQAFGQVVDPPPDIDIVNPTPGVDPTPDIDPNPGTELVLVFDADWADQLFKMKVSVAGGEESISKDSINSISFGSSSNGTYLGKLDSGTLVYYTRSDDGTYSVDFVNNKPITAPTSCDNLFSGCSSLKSMDFSNFDTSNVTSSENMFAGCDSFKTVTGSPNYNLGNLPSSTMSSSSADELISSATATTLGITKDNINSIAFLQASDKTYLTTLESGIAVYYSLTEDSLFELDFVGNKIYAPENCSYLFSGYTSLTSLALDNFDTSNVTRMSFMFRGCISLTSLDLSNFDTSNVSLMNEMFGNCMSLSSLNISSFDTSNVKNMAYMFIDCTSLTSLDLSNFDTNIASRMDLMFSGCENLSTLNLSSFITGSVTKMDSMFDSCWSLTALDLSNFDTGKVRDMSGMFRNCTNLSTLNLSSFNTSRVEKMADMFMGCNSLTNLDLSGFDTSNVVNMSRMFFHCSWLENLDLTNFDTCKVTSYDNMFYGCNSIVEIIVGENYTLDNLPTNCIEFEGLILYYDSAIGGYVVMGITDGFVGGDFTIPSIVDGSDGARNITKIGVGAFSNCQALTSVVIPQTITMIDWSAFAGCSNLTNIVFEDTEGWVVGAEVQVPVVVTDSSANAVNLTGVYGEYQWFKK